MKKIILLVLAIITISLIPPASAEPQVELIISPKETQTYQNMHTRFDVIARNNMPVDSKFKVLIRGPHPEWSMSSIILMHLNKTSERKTLISFYTSNAKPGIYNFNITISSLEYDVNATDGLSIEVFPPLRWHDFSVTKEGNELGMNIDVESAEKEELEFEIAVKNKLNEVITTLTFTEETFGRTTFNKKITLDPLTPPGEYEVIATILGEDLQDGAGFTVPTIKNLETSVKRTTTVWYDEITYEVNNTGNVPSDYYTTQEYPGGALVTGFVTMPIKCYDDADKKLCDYKISSILPGETGYITARVEFWPTILQALAGVIIIAVIIGMTYIRQSNPKIRKKYIRKGKDKHSIVIEVKNSPFRHSRNVIVRDWVSPLANIVYDGFEAIRPVVKKSDAGTELIWNLGDMNPKEVRLMGYKIKTLIRGNLKMPKAYMRFKDKRGNRKRIYSSGLNIE
jgi:hypothetical protein